MKSWSSRLKKKAVAARGGTRKNFDGSVPLGL